MQLLDLHALTPPDDVDEEWPSGGVKWITVRLKWIQYVGRVQTRIGDKGRQAEMATID